MVRMLRERFSGWSNGRRWLVELAVLALFGLFLGAIGPYGTDREHDAWRYPYWLACIVGGGLIGIPFDLALARVIARPWLRLFPVALAMTPLVSLLVMLLHRAMFGHGGQLTLENYLALAPQVFAISLPVMAVRTLVWVRPAPEVRTETRTLVEPPLPEAEAAFRRRLSAKRRTARLIAAEAHDHYLRVHTDAGTELVTMRFADLLAELSGAHGLQVHRSWWVAADAIEGVSWRRGGGEARLAGGLVAPVSRSHAPLLKAAGWF
jgi:hypothetical protein